MDSSEQTLINRARSFLLNFIREDGTILRVHWPIMYIYFQYFEEEILFRHTPISLIKYIYFRRFIIILIATLLIYYRENYGMMIF